MPEVDEIHAPEVLHISAYALDVLDDPGGIYRDEVPVPSGIHF